MAAMATIHSTILEGSAARALAFTEASATTCTASNPEFRRQSSIVQLGVAQTINEHLNLLCAAGRSLRGGDEDPQLLVYFALQFEY